MNISIIAKILFIYNYKSSKKSRSTSNNEQFNNIIIKNILGHILYQIYYLRPLKTDTISCPKAIYKATNLYGPEMENTIA